MGGVRCLGKSIEKNISDTFSYKRLYQLHTLYLQDLVTHGRTEELGILGGKISEKS